ncbi:beta-L-arabinofuranosidase domain-containing protein [Sphingobacterium bambusae]|uniref:Beta-L-arabinofuranosidase domain-containing protein n=1 Tax=Sphingobacterium bambusae TaxID=662858 RepID=A0ABW6BNC9_9SPHI|nr:beta-L-arabinofuranosidase domain-containing protein [Sphingobacterium bambusae]WPL48098.1 glycoside hydrolase family 127 protein [Sphingobacterium bambusae]
MMLAKHLWPLVFTLSFFSSELVFGQRQNKAPLRPNSYMEVAIGDIQAEGWLRQQLERMKTGLTGNLDVRYPEVVGARNAWLGGDGDAWERGPYWIDGLLPLAYQTGDKGLIAKAKSWVEWTLRNQREDGYLGPRPTAQPRQAEAGIQREPLADWWPRMVMLKVLKQYYEATQDKRVLPVLTNYFRYQLRELPKTPLDTWTFWANRRGADNLMIVYWLYNITGDSFLLDLGNLIYTQTFPYERVFNNPMPEKQSDVAHLYPFNVGNRYPFDSALIDRLHVGQLQSFHCVNLAQGIKTPVIFFQQNPDPQYVEAVKRAFIDIERFHGQAQGMYGGDEPMHGNAPTQGIEFCSVVEMLFSLESMLPITGEVAFADKIEKIAYNAMPTQATDDFDYRQYFQTANQVLISKAKRNFFEDNNHAGTDQCFGLLTGYPCCTANMHQGWPKLVQNLWYHSADGGLAALVFGPSTLETTLPTGRRVKISETTSYPFEDQVTFQMELKGQTDFPFHIRIPSWAKEAKIYVNEVLWTGDVQAGKIAVVQRVWKNADQVRLELPMHIHTSRWAEQSIAVERGPLVFALKINERWRKVSDAQFGDFFEVYPQSDWNYGLLEKAVHAPEANFKVELRPTAETAYPWNLQNSPILLKTKAKKIPSWTLYKNMAGPLPMPYTETSGEEEAITLVPYGCSTLRITQLPIVH